MSHLQSKLSTLEAQLSAARAELEAAQSKAAESTDLHEKLNYLTRARAAQDLISTLEQEISAVRHSIAEAQRREHRQELLEKARQLAKEIAEHQSELRDLLDGVAEAVARLQKRAPALVSKWRATRERWMAVYGQLEGQWPDITGTVENSQRLAALQRVLDELGGEGRALLQLPPGLQPSHRLERPSFEGKNWSYAPPSSPEDFSVFVLDALLNRPHAQQPAAVRPFDPSQQI